MSRLHGRLGSHVVVCNMLKRHVGIRTEREVRLVVEGLCKLLMFPWILGGMKPVLMLSITFLNDPQQ